MTAAGPLRDTHGAVREALTQALDKTLSPVRKKIYASVLGELMRRLVLPIRHSIWATRCWTGALASSKGR